MTSEIGLIGLGVMGKSLSRNLARKGYRVSVFNRHLQGTEENVARDFVSTYPEMKEAQGFDQLESFVASLAKPRKIILMVNAGPAVDSVITQVEPFLEPDDILIDAGNSHYEKTAERMEKLQAKGLHLIGTGVSGGEQGALNGPSIMPSGDVNAYTQIKVYLEAIAAQDGGGATCCTYVGRGGSGHFVKMVHNGIEYAEMQLLAECYMLLKQQGLSNDQIANEFEAWTQSQDSYLLRISIEILRKKEGQGYLLDAILDKAGNKGTGKWTTISIADNGQSATMIPAALFARYLSFFKAKRLEVAAAYPTENTIEALNPGDLFEAYAFARFINHSQGFKLIKNLSEHYNWDINLSEIARIWTEGCIIKSDLMKDLVGALKHEQDLILQEKWMEKVKQGLPALKNLLVASLRNEVHTPCLLEAYNYFIGLKTAESSANLIQAQRDYFGAHTYQKKNDPSQAFYHTNWEAH